MVTFLFVEDKIEPMQSNKASSKTRKNVIEPVTAASGEPTAAAEKTAKPRAAAKSSMSKSEPVETTSAKRHRKAAPVSTPEPAVAQSSAAPKALAAAAGSGATMSIIMDPVGMDAPPVASRTAEISRDRIQELAYRYWIADGKPHGNHFDHWLRAERELELVR